MKTVPHPFPAAAVVAGLFALAAASAPAQDLRKGIADADLVAVARQVGKRQVTPEVVVHRLQLVARIRGGDEAVQAVSVLDWPDLSLHQRPVPRQTRLYCLQDQTRAAAKLGLDPEQGPYYRMVGWPGSNPLVGATVDEDPIVRFARTLATADAGADPAATADALATTALEGVEPVRTEAVRLLAERPDLRSVLSQLQWSRFVTRMAGETQDLDYKIALAETCAAQRVDGVADALLLGLAQVQQPEYARTAGRLVAFLHGEDAARRITARLPFAGSKAARDALLLAMGATRTQAALDALQRMQREQGKDDAIEAALREHRGADVPAVPGRGGK